MKQVNIKNIFFVCFFFLFLSFNLNTSESEIYSKEKTQKGKKYFEGYLSFSNKANPCISCHSLDIKSFTLGGGLAKNLTKSYALLTETGINSILNNTPFPVMKIAYENKKLTKEEIECLTSFLYSASKENNLIQYSNKTVYFAFLGFLFLLYIYYCLFFKNKDLLSKN